MVLKTERVVIAAADHIGRNVTIDAVEATIRRQYGVKIQPTRRQISAHLRANGWEIAQPGRIAVYERVKA